MANQGGKIKEHSRIWWILKHPRNIYSYNAVRKSANNHIHITKKSPISTYEDK